MELGTLAFGERTGWIASNGRTSRFGHEVVPAVFEGLRSGVGMRVGMRVGGRVSPRSKVAKRRKQEGGSVVD